MTKVNLKREIVELSEGIHLFKITKSEERQTGEFPYWMFQLTCQDNTPEKGATTLLMVSLSPNARWKTEEFFNACGVPETGEMDHHDFVGKVIRGKIANEEYQGTMRQKCVQVFARSDKAAKTSPVVTAKSSHTMSGSDSNVPEVKMPEGIPTDVLK